MSSDRRWQRIIVPLQIDGVDLQVAALVKPGTGTPLVFLHGFGSTKGLRRRRLAPRPG